MNILTKPDLTYLKEMSGGDKVLMSEIFDIYLEQVPEFINDLKSGLEKSDYNALYMVSHKAKTSVTIVGFNALAGEFKKLEISSKNKFKDEKANEAVNALVALLKETQREIKDLKNSL